MARNTQPILKRCRTLGISPAVLGINKKSIRNPGGNTGRRRRQSEYGKQLIEKQKLKFIYGVLEKQFKLYYERAVKLSGATGENMLSLLERRLDNVAFRAKFASTRRQARQVVMHGHLLVNGKKVDIPSYRVNKGDVVTLRGKSLSKQHFKDLLEENERRILPAWLEQSGENTVTVSALPQRTDIDFEVDETLVVELYSK